MELVPPKRLPAAEEFPKREPVLGVDPKRLVPEVVPPKRLPDFAGAVKGFALLPNKLFGFSSDNGFAS
jgi:hypothetical protein